MTVISSCMLNNSAKDLLKDRLKNTIYQIISLFFSIRSYAQIPKRPDNHLAVIVFLLLYYRLIWSVF